MPVCMATSCIVFFILMSNECFVTVLLLFFGKGQCDSSKLEPLLFRYKMKILCKCIQFIIDLLLVPISTVLQPNERF